MVIAVIAVLVLVWMICEWRHGFHKMPQIIDDEDEISREGEGGEGGAVLQDRTSMPIMTSGVVDGERGKETEDGLVVKAKSNSTSSSGSSRREN